MILVKHNAIRHSRSTGFTLIELLIALVIVAIGALGHAKMQLKSMQMAQRSSFSQSANSALLDLEQRIKGIPDAAVAGEFTFSNLDSGDVPVSNKLCYEAAVTCTRAEFARYELNEWFDEVSTNLPEARFAITKNSNLFTLTLIWDVSKSGGGSNVCDATSLSHQCGVINLWVR